MASENKKFVVQEKGGPFVITTSPKPTTLKPLEVLIRIKAIGINPADCKMAYEGHRAATWPLVSGFDGSGIVENVGDDVKNFVVGDEVLSLFVAGDRTGSFQNFAVVQERQVAKKPKSWSFEEAATIGIGYLTGVVGLGLGLKISLPFLEDGPPNQFNPSSVLVLGGSSTVGAATIQLLRLAIPNSTILTTSSPKSHNHLIKDLGANDTFDRNSASLIKDVKKATPKSLGVDAIIDAVGAGRTERHIFETFNPNGPKRYAQVNTGEGEIEVLTGVESIMFTSRSLSEMQGYKNIMLALQELLEEEKYKLPLPVRKVGDGLETLKEGLELMLKGVSGEKLVVTI